MAASKRPVNNRNGQTWNFENGSDLNPKSSSYSSRSSDAYNTTQSNYGHSNDYDDIFGGPTGNPGGAGAGSAFDFDSVFSGSNAKSSAVHNYDNDDLFGGIPGFESSSSANNALGNDEFFGSFASAPKQTAPVDDLLGGFNGAEAKSKSPTNAANSDDLIPGFGGTSPPINGRSTGNNHLHLSNGQSTKSTFTLSDPFLVFESTSTSNPAYSGGAKPPRLKSPPRAAQVSNGYKGESSGVSSIDELEDFVMGRVQKNENERSNVHSSGEGVKTSATRASKYSEDDIESFFSRANSVPRSSATTSTRNSGCPGPAVPQRTSSGTSTNIKKSSSTNGVFDDLPSMFGAADVSGGFHEVEGESQERRRARLGRHQRTNERAAKAVADMNQRDFQSQQEQEERRIIAETLDFEIKRWAAGKEGNLRALLSSLQYVLGPGCGWESVSLTDMITPASVKKVYRKATLYVHPDKVQQKGASLQEKYTAEKVFDILKLIGTVAIHMLSLVCIIDASSLPPLFYFTVAQSFSFKNAAALIAYGIVYNKA
ncbi:hypothetical protein FNV43_RR12211 [Rhamnella rubrinervis]|uniref:Uncharacterized protein n=1 Tax=Rhamnella rubrinervis TaxID=2594499 RepID=A0A8K0H6Y5_9ROSA|nr:hypothetical protein FNV43_RR12211 [Rhamnella rubrinervis]